MITIPGFSAIETRIGVLVGGKKTLPVSTGTSSGTAVVYNPPTVEAPQNVTQAIRAQLAYSTNLKENSFTGAGIGANQSKFPVTEVKTPQGSYIVLGVLGVLLLAVFAWDRGKL